MDRADYWRDLCELPVIEGYGLTYKNDTAAFANAVHDDVDVIETILLGLEADYRSAYRDYQADEALQLIAWCHKPPADTSRKATTGTAEGGFRAHYPFRDSKTRTTQSVERCPRLQKTKSTDIEGRDCVRGISYTGQSPCHSATRASTSRSGKQRPTQRAA